MALQNYDDSKDGVHCRVRITVLHSGLHAASLGQLCLGRGTAQGHNTATHLFPLHSDRYAENLVLLFLCKCFGLLHRLHSCCAERRESILSAMQSPASFLTWRVPLCRPGSKLPVGRGEPHFQGLTCPSQLWSGMRGGKSCKKQEGLQIHVQTSVTCSLVTPEWCLHFGILTILP